MREITTVNFTITTYCNMACPDCCCDIPDNDNKNHVTWDYVEHAAQFFRGLERIHLTGGEPSLHPKFVKVHIPCDNCFLALP